MEEISDILPTTKTNNMFDMKTVSWFLIGIVLFLILYFFYDKIMYWKSSMKHSIKEKIEKWMFQSHLDKNGKYATTDYSLSQNQTILGKIANWFLSEEDEESDSDDDEYDDEYENFDGGSISGSDSDSDSDNSDENSVAYNAIRL